MKIIIMEDYGCVIITNACELTIYQTQNNSKHPRLFGNELKTHQKIDRFRQGLHWSITYAVLSNKHLHMRRREYFKLPRTITRPVYLFIGYSAWQYCWHSIHNDQPWDLVTSNTGVVRLMFPLKIQRKNFQNTTKFFIFNKSLCILIIFAYSPNIFSNNAFKRRIFHKT